MSIVNIEIDGQKLQVPQGSMVIEAADNAGIPIPRFCYHKKLSIAANCRMCLVQVEKAPKPLPACATPVSEGMKVFTHSKYAKDAQKAVMEFLLINHPLDCPLCDQAGQCELQDVALEYGRDTSEYEEGKRSVKDKDLGPLIQTEMTRCIHCTRCVRFGNEIAGIRELGATGRGEHTEIGTYIEENVVSELSGNVIDLCPVGALTSKPFRFIARAWEITSKAGIGSGDPLGSHLFHHVYQDRVVRTVPRENEKLNEVWLSDKDRFSYTGLNVHRLAEPEIKNNGRWQQVSWEVALRFAAERMQAMIQESTPSQIGALASSSCTLEELYLLQKLMRDLGSKNIDHRLYLQDPQPFKRYDQYPGLNQSLDDFEKNETIFLIGCHPRREIPLLNQRILKAVKQGAQVLSMQTFSDQARYPIEIEILVDKGDFSEKLLGIIQYLLKDTSLEFELPQAISDRIQKAKHHEESLAIAEKLKASGATVILVGQDVLSHPQGSLIHYLTRLISYILKASFGEITPNANGAGAYLAGVLPYELVGQTRGLSAFEMLQAPLKGMILMNLEPEYDCLDPAKSLVTLGQVEEVICLTPYVTETMRSYASVLLPMSPMTETDGTFVNLMGDFQSFKAVVNPLKSSKPAWKILRVLGNFMHLDGYDYNTTKDVVKEIQKESQDLPLSDSKAFFQQTLHIEERMPAKLIRLGPHATYSHNNVLRRSKPLQETVENESQHLIFLNSKTAEELNLRTGDKVNAMQETMHDELYTVALDSGLPLGCALVYAGTEKAQTLNAPYGVITLKAQGEG